MHKSQVQKTTLKRRRLAAVGILLSGLERIAADLHSYGTLPDEPSKPLHCLSDSVALPARVHVSVCSYSCQ